MSLQQTYKNDIMPALQKELALSNVHMVPKIEKIVVNMGLGEALKDKKVIKLMSDQLARITGQKPIATKATKSIATFKLRAGSVIGLKVTLRGKRMYNFIEGLIAVVLPRVRDFRGINPNSFDHRGNISIGFSEMIVFPEVDYDSLDKIRGLEVVIVTSTDIDDQARLLLKKIGIPFKIEE